MNEVVVILSWGCRFELDQNFLTFACLFEGSYYLFVRKHFSKHHGTCFRLDPYLLSRISFANNFRTDFCIKKQYLDMKLSCADNLVIYKHTKGNCFLNKTD